MRRSDPPALVGLSEGLGPLVEPLFLLHCGAVFDGERDDWDTEANSGRVVDELADQHPGETLHLYALTPDDVAAVNKRRAWLEWMKRDTALVTTEENMQTTKPKKKCRTCGGFCGKRPGEKCRHGANASKQQADELWAAVTGRKK